MRIPCENKLGHARSLAYYFFLPGKHSRDTTRRPSKVLFRLRSFIWSDMKPPGKDFNSDAGYMLAATTTKKWSWERGTIVEWDVWPAEMRFLKRQKDHWCSRISRISFEKSWRARFSAVFRGRTAGNQLWASRWENICTTIRVKPGWIYEGSRSGRMMSLMVTWFLFSSNTLQLNDKGYCKWFLVDVPAITGLLLWFFFGAQYRW